MTTSDDRAPAGGPLVDPRGLPYRGLGMSCLPLRTLLSLTIQTLTHLELQGFLALPDVSLNSPVGCPWAHCAGNSKGCKLKHKIRVPFRAKHCYHMGPLTRANDGTPNYDPDGKTQVLRCRGVPCLPKDRFRPASPRRSFSLR